MSADSETECKRTVPAERFAIDILDRKWVGKCDVCKALIEFNLGRSDHESLVEHGLIWKGTKYICPGSGSFPSHIESHNCPGSDNCNHPKMYLVKGKRFWKGRGNWGHSISKQSFCSKCGVKLE